MMAVEKGRRGKKRAVGNMGRREEAWVKWLHIGKVYWRVTPLDNSGKSLALSTARFRAHCSSPE